MAKKRVKIFEGDIFILPLKNGKYAIGLVAISAKNCILAYYFNVMLDNESDFDIEIIQKERTILIQTVSILGFLEESWKVIGKLDSFIDSIWSLPNFKQYSELLKVYYSISYNLKLEEVGRHKIDEKEASKLYPYGMAGYVYAENVLLKLLDTSV